MSNKYGKITLNNKQSYLLLSAVHIQLIAAFFNWHLWETGISRLDIFQIGGL